jgi:UDP-N-acetylmuramate dehydrogenase
MDRAEFARTARERFGDRLVAEAPLAPLTTFQVGGPAEWLVHVRTPDEMAALLRLAAASGLPVTVLGGGSNVLVADAGIRGVVARLRLTDLRQTAAGCVRAEAGVTINGLVRWTIGRGLAGLEAWAGTPGTVGGAIHGNAHWHGRNVGDLAVRIGLLTAEGEPLTASAAEMGFGYDTSRVQTTGEVVMWAEFGVKTGDPLILRSRARESLAFRKRTQPLAHSSAGCVFQNPDPGRDHVPSDVPPSAGALVDRAGLKGRAIGGARISERHGNFVVNEGGATAADIRALIDLARAEVRRQFRVELRDEVVYLGAF